MGALLTSRTNQFNIVLDIPKNVSLTEFDKNLRFNVIPRLEQASFQYIYILHDKDIGPNNEVKRAHYHLILISPSRIRLQTMIYRLCEYFSYGNAYCNAISIDKVISLPLAIQYLLHKNDIDKFQYNKNYIITNLNSDLLDTYLNTELHDEITTELLVHYIIDERLTNLELMYKLGVNRFRFYLPIIDIIRKTYYTLDRDALKQLEYIRNTYEHNK